MNRQYDFDSEKTLAITQRLREEYRAITYNRSDCRYLSSEQFLQAPATLIMLRQRLRSWRSIWIWPTVAVKVAHLMIKISAHTAIIPTPLPVNLDKMTTDEKKVYDVIVAQYLAQFMPEKLLNHLLQSLMLMVWCSARELFINLNPDGAHYFPSGKMGVHWIVRLFSM